MPHPSHISSCVKVKALPDALLYKLSGHFNKQLGLISVGHQNIEEGKW